MKVVEGLTCSHTLVSLMVIVTLCLWLLTLAFAHSWDKFFEKYMFGWSSLEWQKTAQFSDLGTVTSRDRTFFPWEDWNVYCNSGCGIPEASRRDLASSTNP